MNEPVARRMGDYPSRAGPYSGQGSSANLADILERVLDKGIVIAGDIQINLLDIELLTIKLRLLIASVDKAKEMGIDWWEHDPSLSSRAADGHHSLAEENKRLRAEIAALREGAELSPAEEYEEAEEDAGDEAGEADEEADEAEEYEETDRPAAPRRPARPTRTSRTKRAAPRSKRRDES
ncbi:gas vesicle protein [Streptomyces sp. 2112.3]|uniref:gas vesicle protein n=1 Tax=unclassified Streptomyces TaxID=2593676 RepID=UPI00087DF4AC|nr:gas vesicle protein GvpA/GvpJ/GvpM family [Streptomyces sp. 2321.6]SDR56479.1 Gas vesicle protein [Streptomyces sp. KS_16]SEB99988.1 Gas vesicle protein [Streptomyces sp. 2133.1]SEF10683.1 Gas vesicle protein [Streptomyces sp. 2112.3]SNC63560.1 Gas vesicle protein [Streptomyces sp. 2114.4]